MYDDLPPYSYTSTSLGYSCQRFPTLQITTPVAIFYGGRDSLADMNMLLKQIPTPVLMREVLEYEHLGRNFFVVVFVYIIIIHIKFFSLIFYV